MVSHYYQPLDLETYQTYDLPSGWYPLWELASEPRGVFLLTSAGGEPVMVRVSNPGHRFQLQRAWDESVMTEAFWDGRGFTASRVAAEPEGWHEIETTTDLMTEGLAG